MSLLDLLRAPWAIQPEKLLEIQSIYATHLRGEKIDLEGLEARMGRPLANDQQEYQLLEGGVAVLPIEGVLAPKANLFMRISGGASTQMLQQQVESAGADPRVRALILSIDSPGGSVHGSPELAATIAEVAAEKPIVTLGTANVASAAYWIAAAANSIYITGPTVLVGSIGVVATHDYSPRSPGRVVTEVTAGKYKRIATSNEPLTDEGRAYLQSQVDHLYSVFVDSVAANRQATTEQVLEHMADGRVFVGQQAIDAGLVDGVSTLGALAAQLAANPAAFAKRRKAVFAMAGSSSPSAGAAPKDKPQPRERKTAMSGDTNPITRASFEQDHAALFAQVRSEFMVLGASQERDRIQAVLAEGQGMPGHDKLINALAFDGKTTGAEAAQQVLKAERDARAAAAKAHADDAPAAAKPSAAPQDKGAKTKEQQAAEAVAHAKAKGISVAAAVKELGFSV